MLQGGGLAGAAVAGFMCTMAVKYRFVSVDAEVVFRFQFRAVFLSGVRRFPSVFGLPCPVFSSGL